MSLAAALLLAAGAQVAPGTPVTVAVSRAGDGFEAEFQLPRNAPAWGFFRSNQARTGGAWRPASWTVLTPGVRLVRRGRYDALVGEGGRAVPRSVRVRFAPFTGDLVSDYVPALRLGGRGLALFDGHFAIFSVASPDQFERLFERPALSALRQVRIGGLVVNYEDARAGRTWTLDGGEPATIATVQHRRGSGNRPGR